jgi:hypothetical protein
LAAGQEKLKSCAGAVGAAPAAAAAGGTRICFIEFANFVIQVLLLLPPLLLQLLPLLLRLRKLMLLKVVWICSVVVEEEETIKSTLLNK